MGSDRFADAQRDAQRTRDKMAWAQLGVGFLQGLQQSMAQARQERLAQQQQDFQNNLATQRVGLERQGLRLHEEAQNDTRDWRQAQVAREQQQDQFTQQYHAGTLAETRRYHDASIQQQQDEAAQRMLLQRDTLAFNKQKEANDLRAREFDEGVRSQDLALKFYNAGLQPPALGGGQAPGGGQASMPAFDERGYAQAMGANQKTLSGMPTMPAPAPQQSGSWTPGPGMQPELRHALSGIRPKPSYEKAERDRLDQAQVVGDYLRDALNSGTIPNLKGGALLLDGKPVPTQALLDNPALAHRISFELNGSEESAGGALNPTNIFFGETNPKSPLGRMGLRPAEFGAMLAQGASMARQDPDGFASLARIDQRAMPRRSKDILPAAGRNAVGGGFPQVDNAETLTQGRGAPRDVPRERAFAEHPGAPGMQTPGAQAPRPPGEMGDFDELVKRVEGGDPLATITAAERGLIPDSEVPPSAWILAGKEPPPAIKMMHTMRMQQQVDHLEAARRGGMQLDAERGKEVRGPGRPGYGGGVSNRDLMRQQVDESMQRGSAAMQRIPSGPVRREDGGVSARHAMERRLIDAEMQLERARGPQAEQLQREIAELKRFLGAR